MAKVKDKIEITKVGETEIEELQLDLGSLEATTAKLPTEVTAEHQLTKTMDFEADADMGLEEADKETYAKPFLTLLQGLSPQLEEVEGAKPGLFLNTITNELFENPRVIPCFFNRRFLRWAPDRGGFRGEFNPIDIETGEIQTEISREGYMTVEGDSLSDTRNHFVLVESANGQWQPAVISLSSTQIKNSKRWMSLIYGIEMRSETGKMFRPPSFSHIYSVKAVKEKNEKGSWWGFDFSIDSKVSDTQVYEKAKEFHGFCSLGKVEVQQPLEEVQQKKQF